MEKGLNKQRPHVVCVPYPAQGHVNPMMDLAKLLHSRGFHVTFVNTRYNHNRLLRARGPTALNGLDTFRFESIPDGLPESDANVTQDVVELTRSLEEHGGGALRDLVAKLNETASSAGGEVPHVSCMVLDVMMMMFGLDVAQEIGVPAVVFWPAGACGIMGFDQFGKLLDMGIIPFKDTSYLTNGQLDMVLNWISGANDIRLRDLPTFLRVIDHDDFMFQFILRMMQNLKRASSILLNTFNALEQDTIQFVSSNFPPFYTIGPFKLMLKYFDDEKTKSIRSNLWIEDQQCLKWLDFHKHCSVLYVNFGSITMMTNEQLLEFAWGLANSNQPFLWIIRPDMISKDSIIFSSEFLLKIKDRGLITSWCDQEEVLSHPAIGGFLTHNGWNSTLESICSGVPMICWPFFADQQINCWYCCKKWGIGMEIDTNVKRDEIERQVKELMVGDDGKDLRKKVLEWKKLAHDAVKISSGSSYANLEKAFKVLLSQN